MQSVSECQNAGIADSVSTQGLLYDAKITPYVENTSVRPSDFHDIGFKEGRFSVKICSVAGVL